ncbi:MAG: hypothetical protein J6S85_06170 [Methanobrevibacter sp.]|nr:hypothetical protein [Methanobrevibacter sp.]
MENTIERRFIGLYKNTLKDVSKLVIRRATKQEIHETISIRDSISELYVKVVKGKTYLSSESNILEKISVSEFVEIERAFISKCEQEIEQEKNETNE